MGDAALPDGQYAGRLRSEEARGADKNGQRESDEGGEGHCALGPHSAEIRGEGEDGQDVEQRLDGYDRGRRGKRKEDGGLALEGQVRGELAEHANEGQLRDVQGESGLAGEHRQKSQRRACADGEKAELVGKEHREAHSVLHRCHNNRRCASADSQICKRKAEERREEGIKEGNKYD